MPARMTRSSQYAYYRHANSCCGITIPAAALTAVVAATVNPLTAMRNRSEMARIERDQRQLWACLPAAEHFGKTLAGTATISQQRQLISHQRQPRGYTP